jgi:hypothetical protein
MHTHLEEREHRLECFTDEPVAISGIFDEHRMAVSGGGGGGGRTESERQWTHVRIALPPARNKDAKTATETWTGTCSFP